MRPRRGCVWRVVKGSCTAVPGLCLHTILLEVAKLGFRRKSWLER